MELLFCDHANIYKSDGTTSAAHLNPSRAVRLKIYCRRHLPANNPTEAQIREGTAKYYQQKTMTAVVTIVSSKAVLEIRLGKSLMTMWVMQPSREGLQETSRWVPSCDALPHAHKASRSMRTPQGGIDI